MSFTEHIFRSINSEGYHSIYYNDWGDKKARPIIAVHGLTGNGHDFDEIAKNLIEHDFRVIAIDLPGRGRSDFLPNPMDYNYEQYWQDLMMLLAHLDLTDAECVDWLGISLGGLLAIRLAGMDSSPISKLILNDVGPTVPQDALHFIAQVVSQFYSFENLKDLEKRMRETRGLSWGPISDDQWKSMAEHNARALDNGCISYAYDPKIAQIFKTHPIGMADLWTYWKKIKGPTLVLHGVQSLVLTQGIIDDMQVEYKGSALDVIQFPDCGHVPSLMEASQIEKVREWLKKT